jgi:hypothetical protein
MSHAERARQLYAYLKNYNYGVKITGEVKTFVDFLAACAGLYSQVKRAPKAQIKRRTFEAFRPAALGSKSLLQWVRQVFAYQRCFFQFQSQL